MNWIKENRFLAVTFTLILIGVGVLGYFLFSAKGAYEETTNRYTQQAAELNRLETLPLYPDDANLKKLEAQRKEHEARIDELQKDLAAMQIPIEPMTPEQFQDRLRASVVEFTQKATDAGMKLPEKFYMGFDRYQSEPPRPEAAPLLGRELKALEIALRFLPARAVVELKTLVREELPEEHGGTSRPSAAPPSGPGPAERSRPGASDRAGKSLVIKHPFEMDFIGTRSSFQAVLNDLVTSRAQLFIPRLVQAHNEKEKGPTREIEGAVPAAAPQPVRRPAPPAARGPAQAPGVPGRPAAAAPAPPQTTADAPPAFIVGEEHVETLMRVEIADIAGAAGAPPPAAAPPKTAAVAAP